MMAHLGRTVQPTQNFGTSKKIIGRARILRKDMTNPEKLLWKELRRKQIKGTHFRKQHPIAGFVVDFYCHECNLIVELDGDYHDFQIEKDKERTETLEAFGLTVIRFTNKEVVGNINKVITQIATHL
jgi:5-methyltetrahydrofolate--homocysteine methyltransferase/ATP-dependent helicase HrpA